MKRKISKNIFAITGILITLACSVLPYYTVYATGSGTDGEQPDQTITSDDNIVQKILYYSQCAFGGFIRGTDKISSWPTDLMNSAKETIASLMNGGGIYVDENGDYVFTNEASQQLYEAMTGNSSIDAKIVSDFTGYNYIADGYVNMDYIEKCNLITAWARDSSGTTNNNEGGTGNYILVSSRYYEGSESSYYVCTALMAFRLTDDFSYIASSGGQYLYTYFYNRNGSYLQMKCKGVICKYRGGSYTVSDYPSSGDYVNLGNLTTIGATGYFDTRNWGISANDVFNSFPEFPLFGAGINNYVTNRHTVYYYCNNSMLVAKNTVAANQYMVDQAVNQQYIDFQNLGTINKTVIENNNWESIYNNYITNVNVDYQQDPSITPEELRKIQKKYTTQIINAIQEGSENIEEAISLSNRYLQAISVDVRNIIDWLNANGTSGGSGGTSSGLTPEQANTLISLLNQIDNNCQDIASGVTTLVDDDMDVIEQGIGDTNQNLLAIQTALDSIYNKIGTKSPNQPVNLPVDYTDLLDALENTADGKVEQALTVMDAVGLILRTVAPFGYISLIGIILGNLDVEPVEPKFVSEINNASDNASVAIDTDITIDLTWIADLIPVLHAGIVIVFIIGLAWASFYIFQTIGMLFV